MAYETAQSPYMLRAPRSLRTVTILWQRLAKRLRDPYRPERHYMRGPGPKWQAKQSLQSLEGAGRP